MSEIRAVTIRKIAIESGGILTKYTVEYSTGITETYGIPTEKVDKFIKENLREFTKVKFDFSAGAETINDEFETNADCSTLSSPKGESYGKV